MNCSFNKFKNKIIIEVLIKSIVIGVSFGLITFTVPFTYFKATGLEYSLLYLILIALGVWLVISGLLFIILKPSKKKIAKRIDKSLNLNEKVQTMIEYEKEDNFMINLQREDTLDILSKISVKNLSMKFGVFFFLIIGIATISCVTAFAVPAYEEPPIVTPPDTEIEVDDWTVQAIKDLIEEVKAASINEGLKTKYIDELNGLIESIEGKTLLESEIKELVNKVISNVLLEADKVNTNNEVYSTLIVSTVFPIQELAKRIDMLKYYEIEAAIATLDNFINGSEAAIIELDIDFGKLLKESNLNKEDELYKSLIALGDAINDCAKSSSIFADVKEVVKVHGPIVAQIIEVQAENQNIANKIEKTLKELFNIIDENTDLEGGKGEGQEDDDDKNNLPNNNSGGAGTGEVLFGSDDKFFDPEKGEVVYGDVYTKYFGDIIGKFADGVISEELRDFFNHYFDILQGDLEDQA